MTPKTPEQLEQCRQAAKLGGQAGKGKRKRVNRAFALARSKKALDTRWGEHRKSVLLGPIVHGHLHKLKEIKVTLNGRENSDTIKRARMPLGIVASPNPSTDTPLPLDVPHTSPECMENVPERTREALQELTASQPIPEQPIEPAAKPEGKEESWVQSATETMRQLMTKKPQLTARERELLEGILSE